MASLNNRRKISTRRAKKQTCLSFSKRAGANLFLFSDATIISHRAAGTQSRVVRGYFFIAGEGGGQGTR